MYGSPGADSNHNPVQRLCTDLSGDPDFVLGEVYGLRQWQMHRPAVDPYLVGHWGAQWDLYGVNHAACTRTTNPVSKTVSLSPANFTETVLDTGELLAVIEYEAQVFLEEYPTLPAATVSLVGSSAPQRRLVLERDEDVEKLPWTVRVLNGNWWVDGKPRSNGVKIDLRITGSVPVPPHRPALPSCVCGFYAYTDEASLLANSRPYGDVVFGIVRAYGRITQGTKGFRAETAEVVALTRPQRAVVTGSNDPRPTGAYDRYFFAWARPPRPVIWAPHDNEVVNAAYDSIVPDTVASVNTLQELFDLGSHLIEPPEQT